MVLFDELLGGPQACTPFQQSQEGLPEIVEYLSLYRILLRTRHRHHLLKHVVDPVSVHVQTVVQLVDGLRSYVLAAQVLPVQLELLQRH